MSNLKLGSAVAWKRLQNLRQSYLGAKGFLPDYWSDDELLEAYDETLAQRIRWKWRAVWDNLPEFDSPSTLVDLACGSGAASREILSRTGERFRKVVLFDRSARAVQFAAKKIRSEFPHCQVETKLAADEKYLLLVSHVFSELPEEGLKDFEPFLRKADALLWVESGRHQESRRLSELREALRPSHQILAPCPHQSSCGMLQEDQAANWCHFRAPVPKEVHHSAFWREASKQLGIDLRSLPVSFLLARPRASTDTSPGDAVQILAGSKAYKGYVRYHACHRDGVFLAEYMKRNSKDIYAELSEPGIATRFRSEELGREKENGPL